jgi:hypothetical protein
MSKHTCPSPNSEHFPLEDALKSLEHPNRFSLWLVPDQKLERLSTCISDLATKTKTRPHPPHVTVVGWMPWPEEKETQEDVYWSMEKVASEFVKATGKHCIKIVAEGVEEPDDSEAAFYRCVYLNIHQNPSLLALQRISESLLRQTHPVSPVTTSPTSVFYPVLSLAYGNTTPHQRKELVDYAKAHYNDLIQEADPEGFECSRLQLWQTGASLDNSSDNTNDWKCLAEISLAHGSQIERKG